MKERPILFSAPMVRALLDGRKTMTRRAIKTHRSDGTFVCVDHGAGWWPYRSADGESEVMPDGCEYPYSSPYGVTGDRLWVREKWAYGIHALSAARDHESEIIYAATDSPQRRLDSRWRPSIHMPRWASRLTLEIAEVRIERLQEISEADAMAEGAPPSHPSIDVISREHEYEDFSRSWFAQLWDQINGPGSWAANPWVWVVSFRRIEAMR
jgi:hypothetical protein